MELDRAYKVHVLNEWLFVEEEEEEGGKGILNDNIALSLERQCNKQLEFTRSNSKIYLILPPVKKFQKLSDISSPFGKRKFSDCPS